MAGTPIWPDGRAQYLPRAGYIWHGDGEYVIRESKGGKVVAFVQASAGCVFMWGYRDAGRSVSQSAADVLLGGLESVDGATLAKLKARLRDFDARSFQWKG